MRLSGQYDKKYYERLRNVGHLTGWDGRVYFRFWLRRKVTRWRVGTVVDIGCGDGYYITQLPGVIRGIGIEVSEAALTDRSGAGRLPHVICADARSLPLRDGIADLVLILDVIEHIKDDELLLQEVKRVLTPTGRLILSTPNASSYGHSNKQRDWFGYRDATHCNLQGYEYWTRLLETSGFSCLRIGSDFLWDLPYNVSVPKWAQWLIAGLVGILTRTTIGFMPWKQGENYFAIARVMKPLSGRPCNDD